MMVATEPRPELLLDPNPFIEALPPPITFKQLPARLKRTPLAGVEWLHMGADLREPLLAMASQHFVSTAALLEAAAGVQILLRHALLMRNPLNAGERKRMNQVGLVEAKDQLKSLQRLDGAGMLLAGMTATGKTALLTRMLELIAPEQVIDFGHSDACGWYRLKQCVYLRVDHPSNGARGGLLKRILQELDSALWTDYFSQHKKTGNLDTLLVVVCKLLSLHRVALICIDENQQSTFEDSPWRLEFVLFYLSLMNLGISVILAGNPLAFEHLTSFSQVMRRFSTGGICNLHPASSSTEKWWSRDFVPHTREFSLVESWDIEEVARTAHEFENSGGLPGLFAAYNVEVQRAALRRGGAKATVVENDFLVAARSPRFIEVKKIANSVRCTSDTESGEFLDIPPSAVASTRSAVSPKSKAPPAIPTERGVAVFKNIVTRHNTEQTKKTNALVRRLSVLNSLDQDDVRALGITEDLLAELERTVPSAPKTSTSRKGKGKSTGGDGDDAK